MHYDSWLSCIERVLTLYINIRFGALGVTARMGIKLDFEVLLYDSDLSESGTASHSSQCCYNDIAAIR